MPLQMPHVSVCDSHNELPQSEHSLLAVLEQGKPSSSAEFLTSMTSQTLIFQSFVRTGQQNESASFIVANGLLQHLGQ